MLFMQGHRPNQLLLCAYCYEFDEATSTKKVRARLRMQRVVCALEYTSLCLDLRYITIDCRDAIVPGIGFNVPIIVMPHPPQVRQQVGICRGFVTKICP